MTDLVSVSSLNSFLRLFGLFDNSCLQVGVAAGSESASCSKALSWKALESWDMWPPLAVFDLEHVWSSLRDHILEGVLRNIFWNKRKVINVSSLLPDIRSQSVLHSASTQRCVLAICTNMHTHDRNCTRCRLQVISCSLVAPLFMVPVCQTAGESGSPKAGAAVSSSASCCLPSPRICAYSPSHYLLSLAFAYHAYS